MTEIPPAAPLRRSLSDRLLPWRPKIKALRSDVATLRSNSAALGAELAALHARFATLGAEVEASRREIVALHQQLAAFGADSATAQGLQKAREQSGELFRRHFRTEQLLASSPAARPPGAQAAVARLGEPAVSVILPSYNRSAFIGEAIASVQAQGFRAWELWVIDDGSSDDTESVVARFLGDGRVHYVHKPNGGSSSARNLGIRLSSAPLVAYLDSDNLWYPNFLAAAVDHFATQEDADFIYGALVSELHNLDSSCILWRPFDRDALEENNFIDTNVLVHRRALVDRFGEWDTRLSCLNDWDIALRYTVEKPAHPLNVLAASYRKCDLIRASDTGQQPRETEIIREKLAQGRPAGNAANSSIR